MKKFIFASVLIFSMASCSTVSLTSKSLGVETTAKSYNQADLIVSPQKISYTMNVTAKDRRLGPAGIKEKAVALALQEAGNGDVLVAPQYEISTRSGLFGKKIKKVVVTGYSASYKNFKEAVPTCSCNKK
jgi:hypothetical protein